MSNKRTHMLVLTQPVLVDFVLFLFLKTVDMINDKTELPTIEGLH